jgi:hypothetical protein
MSIPVIRHTATIQAAAAIPSVAVSATTVAVERLLVIMTEREDADGRRGTAAAEASR